VPPAGFFRRLREICDRHGILLVVDEVQTGFGRTGRLFGVEHWGVVPDLVATSKALGAGFPLGAVTGRADVMDRLPVASLGSTFGGHPVACAAALKMIEVLERDRLVERATEIGHRIRALFLDLAERYPCVGDVRGVGAMQAIELVKDRTTKEPAPDLVAATAEEAYRRGLVMIKAGLYSNVIRALVPLTITDDELGAGLGILEEALAAALDRVG
jgi:4-aminobutyrate aminotransferase/(S)-3-amino-2-methylpropionate transaminase